MVLLVDVAEIPDLVPGLEARRVRRAARDDAVNLGEGFRECFGDTVSKHLGAAGRRGRRIVRILQAREVLVEVLLDGVHEILVVVA